MFAAKGYLVPGSASTVSCLRASEAEPPLTELAPEEEEEEETRYFASFVLGIPLD